MAWIIAITINLVLNLKLNGNNMRPVSVKELAELLNQAVKQDKGDYIVLVSDDEECNGYHELWTPVFRQGEDVKFFEGEELKLRNSILLS